MGLIFIFCVLQQQDLKENRFCKQVSRKEDNQIWVIPLPTPKMGLSYKYSIGDPFWV